uniref:Claudin 3 n=1 Tax=Scleropages formosus TaxID=113540 RepID=A0A8C9R4W9_SCLFO
MASFALEILGVTLSVLGWVAAIVACALPMWKVTAFIGPNIVTAQVSWEGIWMSCAVQSTGHMQCKVYDSLLALPQDLQAARALTVISILLGFVGLLVAITGAKYTNCQCGPSTQNHQMLDKCKRSSSSALSLKTIQGSKKLRMEHYQALSDKCNLCWEERSLSNCQKT